MYANLFSVFFVSFVTPVTKQKILAVNYILHPSYPFSYKSFSKHVGNSILIPTFSVQADPTYRKTFIIINTFFMVFFLSLTALFNSYISVTTLDISVKFWLKYKLNIVNSCFIVQRSHKKL